MGINRYTPFLMHGTFPTAVVGKERYDDER